MAFQVSELSIQLVEALVPLMPRIKQRDKSLADQLARAASSISLNCGEAEFFGSGKQETTPVHGRRQRGRDAQCAQACGGVAHRASERGGQSHAAAAPNPRDTLEDDARVSLRGG
jgi:hypothetical protein